MPVPAGYTIDPQPQQPANLPAGYTLDQPIALDLTNKQGEGTYQMTDKSGQTAAVPYGQVPQAAQQGYGFADDQTRFRYNRDNAADQNRTTPYMVAAPGSVTPDEKNLSLPMQVVGGVARGAGTLARPILDVAGRISGQSPQDVSSMLAPVTPTERAAKYGTIGAAIVPAAISNPVGTAGAVVGGTVAAGAGQVIGNATGMDPRNTELLSDALGLAGGAAGGMGARPLVSALDFNAQKQAAGALIDSVAGDANKVPVELENSQDAILRLMKWQKSTNPGPTVNRFLNRITDPNKGPLTYEEARDFYELFGKMSVDESNKLAGSVKYDLREMVSGLKQDIGNAADTVGRGADYYQGIGDYATAKKYQDWSDSAKDFIAKEGIKAAAKGAGTVAGGTAAYGLWKWLTGK